MKLLGNNKILLITKIVLPAFLCVALIYFFHNYESFKYIEIYLFISVFGLIIILFNKNKMRFNFILSFLFSIVLCFLVFFLSMFIGSVIIYLIKGLLFIFNISYFPSSDIQSLAPITIASPLLMFYSYKLLFKIEKTNYFFIIKWISVFILIVLGLTKVLFEDDRYFMSWQFVMALALQLILYQKELKTFFSKNKNN